MIVVSDTTAITNLIQINLLSVIHNLYGRLIIPQAVYDELSEFADQDKVLDDHSWIEVKTIDNRRLFQKLKKELDAGEAEAIVLGIELNADLLVIDEIKGRRLAKENGLRIIGLVGILIAAKTKDLIPAVKPYLDELMNDKGFRIAPSLYEIVLKQAGE
ncbi:MAG: DUF3368 domain-containing protein [Saprospiraceae bacterium]|nr:DUF3368 domain-containing protein [Saprospiraceae bacterium]